jgi:hypothetical protein
MPSRSPTALFRSLLLAVLLALAGCSVFGTDDESAPPDLTPLDFSRFSQAPPLLSGRWAWRKSTVFGPGEPGVATPATTGRTETLVFSAPPDSVRVYQDDTLAQHTSRAAVLENTRWGVHLDTLAISTAFLDGPEKVYERVE